MTFLSHEKIKIMIFENLENQSFENLNYLNLKNQIKDK